MIPLTRIQKIYPSKLVNGKYFVFVDVDGQTYHYKDTKGEPWGSRHLAVIEQSVESIKLMTRILANIDIEKEETKEETDIVKAYMNMEEDCKKMEEDAIDQELFS